MLLVATAAMAASEACAGVCVCDADATAASMLVLMEELPDAHTTPVNSVAFSPDGTRIASGSGAFLFGSSQGASINIWNWVAQGSISGSSPPRLTLTNTKVERATAHGSEAV